MSIFNLYSCYSVIHSVLFCSHLHKTGEFPIVVCFSEIRSEVGGPLLKYMSLWGNNGAILQLYGSCCTVACGGPARGTGVSLK